jgi:uncharacterized membrane protein YccC
MRQGTSLFTLPGRLLQWARTHDPGYVALRRAGRTAIVMPGVFALCVEVIHNAAMAQFAAFGAISLLMLVDFAGPMRSRLQAQAALSVTGLLFVCVGTLASRSIWLATVSMAIVALVVIFAGVISSVLAGATASLLLAFILPVSVPGPASAIPDRLAGWGMASGAALLAVWLLWPVPNRSPLKTGATGACRALAARLRADVAWWQRSGELSDSEHEAMAEAADSAVAALHRGFLATPWRPTGLSAPARTMVRLVDELLWLETIVTQVAQPPTAIPVDLQACTVRSASAVVLDRAADLLDDPSGPTEPLAAAREDLRAALDNLERRMTAHLPIEKRVVAAVPSDPERSVARSSDADSQVEEFVSSLDPGFRAQELGFATLQIAGNADLSAAAERRTWIDLMTGRQPGSLAGRVAAARERAAAHVDRHSVWLHNSVRGAVGLGLAVLIAEATGVQNSFWVILGAFSVLRSNALNTGQNALRALLGTVIGFVVGAAVLQLVGTNFTVLWFLLPVAILIAGFAPTAISFLAGQAGFTVALVILINLVQPAGWRVGLIRVEDVALGCAVSLGIGLLFWPRGAAAALGSALNRAYSESATYLAAAANYGMGRCDDRLPATRPPSNEVIRAAAASRRLDDAFRTYIAERGSKPIPVPEVTALVTGVATLRQTADAVVAIWERDDGQPGGDRTAARVELSSQAKRVTSWYERLGAGLSGQGSVPGVLTEDHGSDRRLVDAVRNDLRAEDGRATATAVRMIWTGDHLDAARRLEASLVGPAEAVADQRAGRRLGFEIPWLAHRRPQLADRGYSPG